MPTYISVLHFLITVSLGLLSGIALSLTYWTMPIVRLGPTTSSKIRQFNHIIYLGATYLQPSSRITPALMLTELCVAYSAGDPRWKHYLAAISVMVPVGPWEIFLIFPVNDEIKEVGEKLKADKKNDFGDGRDADVERLFDEWLKWHTARWVAPTVAMGIMVGSALELLPF